LQALGSDLLASLGAEQFATKVLGEAAGIVVVDGVRHVAIDDALRKIADRYVLVYVEVDEKTRRERLGSEENRELLAGWDRHPTETDLPRLRARADLQVSSDDCGAIVATLGSR
jgi:D-serine deaminase-like pyridoxal phosphate-dependent protein